MLKLRLWLADTLLKLAFIVTPEGKHYAPSGRLLTKTYEDIDSGVSR